MKTNETGRSMVEMLGVLAIIGVLSIGGIAGYTMAMNRYRANEVVDMATKYAVIAYTSRETNKAMHGGVEADFAVPSLTETGLATSSTINGVTIDKADVYDNAVAIVLTFDENSENVCLAAASALGYSSKPAQAEGVEDEDYAKSLSELGYEECGSKKIHLVVKQS